MEGPRLPSALVKAAPQTPGSAGGLRLEVTTVGHAPPWDFSSLAVAASGQHGAAPRLLPEQGLPVRPARLISQDPTRPVAYLPSTATSTQMPSRPHRPPVLA